MKTFGLLLVLVGMIFLSGALIFSQMTISVRGETIKIQKETIETQRKTIEKNESTIAVYERRETKAVPFRFDLLDPKGSPTEVAYLEVIDNLVKVWTKGPHGLTSGQIVETHFGICPPMSDECKRNALNGVYSVLVQKDQPYMFSYPKAIDDIPFEVAYGTAIPSPLSWITISDEAFPKPMFIWDPNTKRLRPGDGYKFKLIEDGNVEILKKK